MSKVLVVGSEGFIGSHLMKRRPEWEGMDLKSGQDVRNGIEGDYDVIVLLAAQLGQEEEDYAHNLEIYTALVRNYVDKKHPYVIYTSSAAVYMNGAEPHIELEEPDPPTIYGESKALGERIIHEMFSATTLRLSNVFGDGEGNGVIDIFKRGGTRIYGDGEQIRDYVYVGKVVEAILRVEEDIERYVGKTYNISSGAGITVKKAFEKYAAGKPEFLPPRNFDVDCSILSNKAAYQDGLI